MAGDVIEVAVVGCGPYGLSVAAHLRDRKQHVRVFGKPLDFWRTQTPAWMLLRSPYHGSNIGDPHNRLALQAYERDVGSGVLPFPLPVADFIAYGEWARQKISAEFDERDVTTLERVDGEFRLTIGHEEYRAHRVVVAAGIGAFPWRPPQFDDLDPELVSHTLDHHDLSCFAGRRVAVVGGGQSALESAALMHEMGVYVDVFVRAPVVHWLSTNSLRHRLPVVKDVLYSKPDVGPMFFSHVVARPAVWPYMPQRAFDRWAPRAIRPAGAAWLRPRVAPINVRTNVSVIEASESSGAVRLRLNDGTDHTVDHVLLGTGYRVDVARYPFMSPELGKAITCTDGYPRLDDGFETSVPGLHIVGAPAARTFGPLMRFVAGSKFAGKRVARALRR